MAYIQPAQSGNYSDGSTWVGGAVPTSSNSDGPNMNVGGYTITLTSNIDDAAMRILVQGAGAAACTFVTGAYDLNVRDIRVSQNAICNLGTGDHVLNGLGGYGLDVASFATANVIMGGCTIKSTAWKLRGNLTATGENTMNWGGGEDWNVGGSFFYGAAEGSYGADNTWENDCSRIHFVVDMTGMSSPENIQWTHYIPDSAVDGDGPYIMKWASVTYENVGKYLEIETEDGDNEWAADNTIVWDVGAGGHGLTNEGDFKITAGDWYMSGNDTDSLCNGLRVRDDMTVGNNSSSQARFFAGHTTTGLRSYIRVDGDLKLDGSALGDTDAVFYAPNFEMEDNSPSAVQTPYTLKGALMVFGTFTNEGVLWYYDSSSKDMLHVLGGITAGTWKIGVSGGDLSSANGYDGLQNENGTFTYGNWQEIAVHENHPSGISLGTKPDAGTNSIQVMDLGGSTSSNLIFNENADFANITIDANATITVNDGITVTYTGTFTNNGTLTETGSGSLEELVVARTCSVSGNYNATATWGGSSVPDEDLPVIINTARTLTVNVDSSAKSISFNSGSGQLVLASGSTMSIPVAQSGDDGKLTLQHADSSITGTGNIKGLSAASPLHCTFRSDTDCEILGNLENCYLLADSDITIHGSAINCTFADSTANIRVWIHTLDSQQMLDSDPNEDDDLRLERPSLDSNLQLTN